MGSSFTERMSCLALALDKVKEAAYACLDPDVCGSEQAARANARQFADIIEAFAGDSSACRPQAAPEGEGTRSHRGLPSEGAGNGYVSGLQILLNTLVAEREFLGEYGTFSMPDREFEAQVRAMLESIRPEG